METSNKRKALGRGLEELFGGDIIDYNSFEDRVLEEVKENKEEITDLPLSELRSNPYQPRKVFDEKALAELAASIKENGVIQPIIVKKSIKGYEIIAGERRCKASKMAGLTTIPAIIRDLTDDEMMQIALLENLQRENLNAIEEASAYKNILNSLSLTQDELAKKLGKSRSHITNMIGLLKLPKEIKDLIQNGKITMGHARVLSKIEDDIKVINLAEKIVSEGLSVRQVEVLADDNTYERKVKIKNTKADNRPYKFLEDELQEILGSKVKISNKKIEIYYDSEKDLNRLLDIMNLNKQG